MAVPIWISDADGNLVYYNEPAEAALGVRFDEAGELSADTLADRFVTTAPDGTPLLSHDLPIMIALTKQIPAHRPMKVRALDGIWHDIEVTAVPITGEGGRHLGVMTAFWQAAG
jgi:YD repeat-containing protein